MTSHDFVMARREEALASSMTCPLCHKLFQDPTTIVECIHTFCRECIYKKLLDDKITSCPLCNIDLGCTPLDKLKSDHNWQGIMRKTFPSKSTTVKHAGMVTQHVNGKEKSLSPLAISMSGSSTARGKAMFSDTKTSRSSHYNLRKRKHADYNESSSSMDVLNKYTRNGEKKYFVARSIADLNLDKGDKGKEKTKQTLIRNHGPCKQSNCLANVKNKSEPPKFSTQVSVTKYQVVTSYDNEGLTNKVKGKEKFNSPIVYDVSSDEEYDNEGLTNKEKSKEKCDSPVVYDVSSDEEDICPKKFHSIWFSLVASKKMEGNNPPLPQISASYIRVKDGRMPVTTIQKYLKEKLDLTSEHEVEIKCMGQRAIPTWTLNDLVEMWLQTTSTERVSATIGSSAGDFVMVLSYARGFPDLNKSPAISPSP